MSNDTPESASDGDHGGGGGLRSGLEAVVSIKADHDLDAFEGGDLIESLEAGLRERLGPSRIEMSLTPEGLAGSESPGTILAGELRIALGAAVDPETLEETLTNVLEGEIAVARGLLFRIARLEPGVPDPAGPSHPSTSAPT